MAGARVEVSPYQVCNYVLASGLERAAIMPVPEVEKDALCMYALAMFLWTLSNAYFWLSDRESDEAYHHGVKFLVLYRSLAFDARSNQVSR